MFGALTKAGVFYGNREEGASKVQGKYKESTRKVQECFSEGMDFIGDGRSFFVIQVHKKRTGLTGSFSNLNIKSMRLLLDAVFLALPFLPTRAKRPRNTRQGLLSAASFRT